MQQPSSLDSERDIVPELLAVVVEVAPELTDAQRMAIAATWQQRFAGVRTRFAKRRRQPTAEDRRRIFEDAMTDKPTEEVTNTHGIHRSTLYRLLKRG